MSQRIVPGSLVLYKTRPARVTEITDKIEIALSGDKPKRVRDKDITLLHPGPVDSLDGLSASEGNLEEARELLSGETVPLADLAELLFGDFTPATAWSSWQLVAEGLYFTGTPAAVTGRDADAVAADIAEREARVARERAWEGLITRLKQGKMADGDRRELGEVERVALGRTESSRVLQALGISESREHAHRLLSRVGYWDEDHDPYPARFGAPAASPVLEVPGLPVETRRDLTHLPAYAIDDEGNEDPDDALSIDGDRLWVHVADAAALVPADAEIDTEARSRGANLYLPEGVVNMLPEEVTQRLGLGLQETSPALSVGMRVADDGSLHDVEVCLTTVRVQRISYAEADSRLADGPLREIVERTRRFRARRFANGAASIDLPEAIVRLVDGEVRIRPVESHTSREVVTDAMLMAGESVASYAMANDIAIPFVGQPVPEEIRQPGTLSAMYAYRRLFKPSSSSLGAQPHFGLGLEVYTRVTSPLRRYLDLLTHQQLRAHLGGADPLPREELGARMAQADAASATVRRTERFANRHWKLVYLKHHPGWEGDAVVLDLEERRAVVVLPALALEARLRRTDDMALDRRLRVAVAQVDLPDLDVRFRVLG
jgi:exoribonuclease-2